MALLRRIGNLFRRSRIDREIHAALTAHLEMRVEDNVAAGMSPEEARRNALVRFGNPTATKERTMAADAGLALDSLWRDIRYALRQLRKTPVSASTDHSRIASAARQRRSAYAWRWAHSGDRFSPWCCEKRSRF